MLKMIVTVAFMAVAITMTLITMMMSTNRLNCISRTHHELTQTTRQRKCVYKENTQSWHYKNKCHMFASSFAAWYLTCVCISYVLQKRALFGRQHQNKRWVTYMVRVTSLDLHFVYPHFRPVSVSYAHVKSLPRENLGTSATHVFRNPRIEAYREHPTTRIGRPFHWR